MADFADRTIWTWDNLDILRVLSSTLVDVIYRSAKWVCRLLPPATQRRVVEFALRPVKEELPQSFDNVVDHFQSV